MAKEAPVPQAIGADLQIQLVHDDKLGYRTNCPLLRSAANNLLSRYTLNDQSGIS